MSGTTRPVLSIQDLDTINEGLRLLIKDLERNARKAARSGDTEVTGEWFSLVTEATDLRDRLDTLQQRMVSEAIEEFTARAMAEVQAEEDGFVTADEDVDDPTDEVGTVALTTAIREAEGE